MNPRERQWYQTWSEWSRRMLIAAAIGAMILAARTVLAEEPVVWHCWFEAKGNYVYCDATRPLPPQQVAALGELGGILLTDGEPIETVPVSLTRVGMVRAPSSQWRFPLHTIPRDMDRVKTLTKVLMCGTTPDCQVLYSGSR